MLKKEKIDALVQPMKQAMAHSSHRVSNLFAVSVLDMTEKGRYPSQRAAAFYAVALYDLNIRGNVDSALHNMDMSLLQENNPDVLSRAAIAAYHQVGDSWYREGKTVDEVLDMFKQEKHYRNLAIHYFSKLMAHPGERGWPRSKTDHMRQQACKHLALLCFHPVEITRKALEANIHAPAAVDDKSFRMGEFYAKECELEDLNDKTVAFVYARALMLRGETAKAENYFTKAQEYGADLASVMTVLAGKYEGYKILISRHYGQPGAYAYAGAALKAGEELLDLFRHENDRKNWVALDHEMNELAEHFNITRTYSPAAHGTLRYDR